MGTGDCAPGTVPRVLCQGTDIFNLVEYEIASLWLYLYYGHRKALCGSFVSENSSVCFTASTKNKDWTAILDLKFLDLRKIFPEHLEDHHRSDPDGELFGLHKFEKKLAFMCPSSSGLTWQEAFLFKRVSVPKAFIKRMLAQMAHLKSKGVPVDPCLEGLLITFPSEARGAGYGNLHWPPWITEISSSTEERVCWW